MGSTHPYTDSATSIQGGVGKVRDGLDKDRRKGEEMGI
jgi:hypothetical protein